jgi:vacuolar iron transporter family protein
MRMRGSGKSGICPVAVLEAEARMKKVQSILVAVERRHAALWEKRLRAAGHAAPRHRPSLRTRLLIQLARRFGAGFVAPSITAREMKDRDHYAGLDDADALGNNLRAAVLGANDGVASNF